MKVFGTLERAQAELLSGDPTGAGLITGRFFYNTTSDDFKYYNGSVRTVANLDEAQTFSNKTLTGNILASFTPDGVNTITVPTGSSDTVALVTSDQVLTNKALPTIRLPHQSTPSTPSSGNILLYAKSDNKLYALDSDSNEFPIGSGGGGALNFYENGEADLAQLADFTEGSDAEFGNGGSTSSTFSITATNPARGSKSFQLVLNATPGNSDNDYVESETIDIPLGYRGRFLSVRMVYNYSGADNEIKFVVKDKTNNALLTSGSELLEKYVPSNNEYVEFNFAFYCPSDCAQISLGPQVVSHAAGSEVLKYDDVVVTPDLFASKDLIKHQYATKAGMSIGFDSDMTGTLDSTSGGGIFTYNSLTGEFTVLQECRFTMSLNVDNGGSGLPTVIYNGNPISRSRIYTDIGSTSVTIQASTGDVFRGRNTAGGATLNSASMYVHATASSEHIVTPASSGSEEFRVIDWLGLSSNNLAIPYFGTEQVNTISKLGTISNNSSDGCFFTAKQACVVNATAWLTATSNSYVGFSKNPSASELDQDIASGLTSGLGYHHQSAAATPATYAVEVELEPGDVFYVHSITARSPEATAARSGVQLTVRPKLANLIAAIPKDLTTYVYEVQPDNTPSSTALSAGSYVTNTLNTIKNNKGFLSLSSNQITLEPGEYDIETEVPFWVNNSTGNAYYAKARIYNVTDSSVVQYSISAIARNGGTVSGHMDVSPMIAKTTVILNESKTFEIQTRTNITSGSAIGTAVGFGEEETYTSVKITKKV